jgi:MFS transporter, PHS family, inorganic phosphate transporter
MLGIGIGGDHTTSSIFTSEYAIVKWLGAMMASVFASQGLGQFFASLVAFLCTVRFKGSLLKTTCDFDCQLALDKSWRIIYGLGAIPACVVVYFHFSALETLRYTLHVSGNSRVAAADAIKYVSGKHGSARLGDVGYIPDALKILENRLYGPTNFLP